MSGYVEPTLRVVTNNESYVSSKVLTVENVNQDERSFAGVPTSDIAEPRRIYREGETGAGGELGTGTGMGLQRSGVS